MAGDTERQFAADPHTPAAARSFAKDALGSLVDVSRAQELCDDLELIVSELVTNAVRAGSATVGVGVSRSGDRVVLRVSDEAVGWPEQREAAADDPGGRGLPLVSALSTSWGVRLVETGKIVWAELAVPSR